MFGRKKNRVHSAYSHPSKGVLQPDQQLSLMLQQVSSQLNLMLSLQQQQQQQYINNLKSTYGPCSLNELDRQAPYAYSHHQRQCPYQNDVLTQPPILSYSQPNFCGGSRGPCAPSHSQQYYQQCPLSPSASSLLSSAQHSCPHDLCHQSRYTQQCHSCDPYSQNSIPPPCQPYPQVNQQHYPTRMNSISGATSYCSAGTFNKQPNYSDLPLGHQSNPIYAKMSMRTKLRSRTDPLPPVPSFGNSIGNDIGHPQSDSSPPLAENLFMQQQPELSWTDIYRQNLQRPDVLASPLGSSFNAASIISATQTRIKSGHSHLRGWWAHGKLKWRKFKKTGRTVLF